MGSNRLHRLRGPKAFANLLQRGRRCDGRYLQVIALTTTCPPGRVGFIIGRKQLRRAVDRNYLRRRLREALRARRAQLGGFDVIVRLRRECARDTLGELALEAGALMDALVRSDVR